jgi:acetoin:2,6-dichlorophenolindophenol oxidoreductase subunit alpha
LRILDEKKNVGFYKQMLRIRMVEEKLMHVFSNGEVPGFIHVCIGQEAAPVAVCANLEDSDFMASTHRGHGHALAKGMDLNLFMAEIFGKRNGPCRGRSGSMHLANPSLGILGANGIVGGGLPIANGAAFASRYKKTKQVTVCFFGEGSTGEGTFHESLNIAAIFKLPIIFVCENNGWAEFTPQHVHMSVNNIADYARSYNMPGEVVHNDVIEIYEAAAKAVDNARKGQGPTLLEIKSSRWHGHYVGDAQKYRPLQDVKDAMKSDCIASFEQMLLKNKLLKRSNIGKIRENIRGEIETAVEFARSSPLPEPSKLTEGVFV